MLSISQIRNKEFNKSRGELSYYPFCVRFLLYKRNWMLLELAYMSFSFGIPTPSHALRSFLMYLWNTKLSSAFFFLFRLLLHLRDKCFFRFCLFSALVGENVSMLYVHALLLHTLDPSWEGRMSVWKEH